MLLRLLADGDVLLMCYCICYVPSHTPPCCHDVQVRPRLGGDAGAVLSGLLADGDVLQLEPVTLLEHAATQSRPSWGLDR